MKNKIISILSEGEIGHGSVRTRQHAQRAIETIGGGLRHLHIARNNGRRIHR